MPAIPITSFDRIKSHASFTSRTYVAVFFCTVLILFLVYLSSGTDSLAVRASLIKEEAEWESNDEVAQWDSPRPVVFEDPEKELGDSSGEEVVTSGEGAIPELKAEVENEEQTSKDPYIRLCGSKVTARGQRPGAQTSNTAVQYVHIPKAGGMSIQHALESWVKSAGLHYFKHDGTTVQGSSTTCPNEALSHDVFAGHRGWGFCDGIKRKRKMFIFTVFREPVARMVSLFDYNLKSRHTPMATRAFGGKSLSQWIKYFNSTPKVEHGEWLLKYSGSQQARFMCGYECLGPAGRGKTEEILLKKALENLRDITRTRAVGYLENFNDILDQLKVNLRWVPKNAGWPSFNVLTPTAKSKLTEETDAIMRQWAWVDIKLYEEAVKIADKMTSEARECMEKVQAWKDAQRGGGNSDSDDDVEVPVPKDDGGDGGGDDDAEEENN